MDHRPVVGYVARMPIKHYLRRSGEDVAEVRLEGKPLGSNIVMRIPDAPVLDGKPYDLVTVDDDGNATKRRVRIGQVNGATGMAAASILHGDAPDAGSAITTDDIPPEFLTGRRTGKKRGKR